VDVGPVDRLPADKIIVIPLRRPAGKAGAIPILMVSGALGPFHSRAGGGKARPGRTYGALSRRARIGRRAQIRPRL